MDDLSRRALLAKGSILAGGLFLPRLPEARAVQVSEPVANEVLAAVEAPIFEPGIIEVLDPKRTPLLAAITCVPQRYEGQPTQIFRDAFGVTSTMIAFPFTPGWMPPAGYQRTSIEDAYIAGLVRNTKQHHQDALELTLRHGTGETHAYAWKPPAAVGPAYHTLKRVEEWDLGKVRLGVCRHMMLEGRQEPWENAERWEQLSELFLYEDHKANPNQHHRLERVLRDYAA